MPPISTRPQIAGNDSPIGPYPTYLSGTVERGFGRGGKDLGCPTGQTPPLSAATKSLLLVSYSQLIGKLAPATPFESRYWNLFWLCTSTREFRVNRLPVLAS